MSVIIRAHFDGKVIIPDEPVNLPVNEPLELELHSTDRQRSTPQAARLKEMLDTLRARPLHGLNIPAEALRRENLYEE